MKNFEVTISTDYDIIKTLFVEYSQIKGAEGCFVSFEKELADLAEFYKGGAILVGFEDGTPIATIALKKVRRHNRSQTPVHKTRTSGQRLCA